MAFSGFLQLIRYFDGACIAPWNLRQSASTGGKAMPSPAVIQFQKDIQSGEDISSALSRLDASPQAENDQSDISVRLRESAIAAVLRARDEYLANASQPPEIATD
jgi:hypothetical protein